MRGERGAVRGRDRGRGKRAHPRGPLDCCARAASPAINDSSQPQHRGQLPGGLFIVSLTSHRFASITDSNVCYKRIYGPDLGELLTKYTSVTAADTAEHREALSLIKHSYFYDMSDYNTC